MVAFDQVFLHNGAAVTDTKRPVFHGVADGTPCAVVCVSKVQSEYHWDGSYFTILTLPSSSRSASAPVFSYTRLSAPLSLISVPALANIPTCKALGNTIVYDWRRRKILHLVIHVGRIDFHTLPQLECP